MLMSCAMRWRWHCNLCYAVALAPKFVLCGGADTDLWTMRALAYRPSWHRIPW